MATASTMIRSDATQQRVLLINLDFTDFVYSFMWGRAVLEGCRRRQMAVDMIAVHPSVGRDLAAELGIARSALLPKFDGTVVYIESPDASLARTRIDELLERQRYDTLILNCDASLFVHLMMDRERELRGARWLVYDRHLHVDLRAHDRDVHLRERIVATGAQLFVIQEIVTGSNRETNHDESGITRSLKQLGFNNSTMHLQKWPLDDGFFAPQRHAEVKDKIVVFSGGDSGRDYATLFEAIRELPVQLRLCAGNYPKPVPANVIILPRLALHQFRDEIARATIVAVPLTGHPPVCGITVIAMAMMMGKAVIASDNPVVRMHIPANGDGGLLAPIGDVAALRSRLMQLIDLPAERNRLGQEARAQASENLSLRVFVKGMLGGDEDETVEDEPQVWSATATNRASRLRIAARCESGMQVDTLPADSTNVVGWVRERVEALGTEGMRGPLYFFLLQPPDHEIAEALRWVVADRRVEPAVIVDGAATRAHLALLQKSGVQRLYATLRKSGPTGQGAGQEGDERRALALLLTAPQVLERVRVGVHFLLSEETSEQLAGVLQVMRRLKGVDLLLWDAGCGGMEAVGLEAAAALRALDSALAAAHRLGVTIQPVGFERVSTARAGASQHTAFLNGAVARLLQNGIPLPSAARGVLATDGEKAGIAEAAATGAEVGQLAPELAALGIPVLDLPPCLGGPPPESRVQTACFKVDACRGCPLDERCSGVPRALSGLPGVREEVRPPNHWLALSPQIRVAVVCTPAYDTVYAGPFFSLARWLAELGARVDVVTPWTTYTDVPASLPETQPMGRPDGADEISKFMTAGAVDQYDLIVTPDPKVTHPLVVSRRLRPETRLAITDFHMLGGMDEWVRDLCARGRRPEEGGWWPSQQIMLYSGFPGYGWLYKRYGLPMRQVAWQPYVLDPTMLPQPQAVRAGTSIVSGGNHRRDLATLLAAVHRVGNRMHPLDLFASVPVPDVPPQVRFGGVIPTSEFCEVVSRSRFMVVPLLADAHYAAGVTAIVTALMCGRPIVATDSSATRDYIIDGVSGLLVPPADPTAMAAAIERLDNDEALLETLAAGAREAATKLTTESWARALVFGSGTYKADHWMWTKWHSRQRAIAAVR